MKAIRNVNVEMFRTLNKGFVVYNNTRGKWRIGCRYISSVGIGMGDVEWKIKLIGVDGVMKSESWELLGSMVGSMVSYLGRFGLRNARVNIEVEGKEVLLRVLITGEELGKLVRSRELKREFLEWGELQEVVEVDLSDVSWEWISDWKSEEDVVIEFGG